jgi:O-antigen ligase
MNTRAQGAAFRLPRAGAAASPAGSGAAGRTGDSLLCALFLVYLASLLLEGVLRYAVAMAGVPNALYVRDAIPVATLIILFLRPLLSEKRIDLAIAIPVAILAFHAAYSAMAGVAFFSIAFGLKIFMFIPYGMAMWPLVRRRLDAALTVAAILFAVSAAGVFANFFLQKMPWEGIEYETAFGAVSTTRMWWIVDGISRLPGFARTSFDAAMALGITGVLAMVKFRRPLARLGIAICAIAAIVLTTSKGMVLAFPLAALWLAVHERKPRITGAGLVGAVCAATLTLPLLVVFFDLGSAMSPASFPALVVSVWDRFSTMWPLAFQLLPDGPQALLGGGLGSIGTPQLYGDAPHRLNAADNFSIFMLVNFGLPGLFYYAMPAFAVRAVAAAEKRTVHGAFVALLLLGYGYGMSISMVETSLFSMFFGLCCGVAISAWVRPVES